MLASTVIAPVTVAGDPDEGSRTAPPGADANVDFMGEVAHDGRSALLAFADTEALVAWSSEHPFVAVRATELCRLVRARPVDGLGTRFSRPAHLAASQGEGYGPGGADDEGVEPALEACA